MYTASQQHSAPTHTADDALSGGCVLCRVVWCVTAVSVLEGDPQQHSGEADRQVRRHTSGRRGTVKGTAAGEREAGCGSQRLSICVRWTVRL